MEQRIVKLVRSSAPLKALKLLEEADPSSLNERMFAVVANGLARFNCHTNIKNLFTLMEAANEKRPDNLPRLTPSRQLWNSLIHASFRQNTQESIESGSSLFSQLIQGQLPHSPAPSTDTYNICLKHSLIQKNPSQVSSLLSQMSSSPDTFPNLRTFHVLIHQSAYAKTPFQTRRYIQQLLDSGMQLTQATVLVLVRAYVSIGDVESATKVFMEASSSPALPISINELLKIERKAGKSDKRKESEGIGLCVDVHNKCQSFLLEGFANKGDLEGLLRIYLSILLSPHSGSSLTKHSYPRPPQAPTRSKLIAKANNSLVEALIRSGNIKEASTLLLGGSYDLMGIVSGVIERQRREARLKALREDPTTSSLPSLSGNSLMLKLFDSNNQITRTQSTITTSSAFPTLPSVTTNAMATTSKFSKTLHTLLLREIASTSTTPIPELLSYLQSCKQAEITLNPSAYQAVLRYFLKSTPHLEKHTLYEHLCTLATLHPNPPLNIYTPLLTSLTQRIQTLRRAQRLSRTTSDNDTDSTTSTIEALTETSWSLYNSVFTPSTSTSTSQPQLFPTSVLSNLLTIHISSQPRFLTILETLSPHTSQPLTAHIYTLLLRHASRQMKDFTAVQGFYAAYEASTVRDARVVQAMLSSCIWFRRYDVAREVLGRCKGGAGLEGTGWWWRRFGRVVKALEDGEGGDVKVERRVKRLKGRGGVGVWRRVRRRKEGEGEEGSGSGSGDVWDRLITSVGV